MWGGKEAAEGRQEPENFVRRQMTTCGVRSAWRGLFTDGRASHTPPEWMTSTRAGSGRSRSRDFRTKTGIEWHDSVLEHVYASFLPTHARTTPDSHAQTHA